MARGAKDHMKVRIRRVQSPRYGTPVPRSRILTVAFLGVHLPHLNSDQQRWMWQAAPCQSDSQMHLPWRHMPPGICEVDLLWRRKSMNKARQLLYAALQGGHSLTPCWDPGI